MKRVDESDGDKTTAPFLPANGGEDGDKRAMDEAVEYRQYPMRWSVFLCSCCHLNTCRFMMAIVALLNFSNTAIWICLAPVSNHCDGYLGADASTYLSLIYMLTTVPIALPAMFLSRRMGLRFSIVVAGFLNGFGASLRIVGVFVPEHRFLVSIIGAGTCGVAYPFIMCMPAKIGGAWFSDSQRWIATTVITLSNPLGVLLPNLISPQLVGHKEDVPYAVILFALPCMLSWAMAWTGVRSSDPPTPPSRSASSDSLGFFTGVKKDLLSRSFLVRSF